MNKIINLFFCLLVTTLCNSQITANTYRAKLETTGGALFGGQLGTTVYGLNVGFNLYSGPAGATTISAGYSGYLNFSNGHFNYTVFPSTGANTPVGIAPVALSLGTSTGTKILTTATLFDAVLDVGRGTSVNGTAVFYGSSFSSHFNYGTQEDTYIRGGKPGSRVILNDVFDQPTIRIGEASSIVGVNYNNPVCTFEIRQSDGTGIKFRPTPTENWEWRVAGSPANFYVMYNGVSKGYFRASDGDYIQLSDERLKTAVEDIPSVMEKVLKLTPTDYEMKESNPLHRRSIGFIAQEVEEVFPQLVHHFSNTKLGLVYSGFAPVAIKAIQEQQELINAEFKFHEQAKQLLQQLENKLNKKNNSLK